MDHSAKFAQEVLRKQLKGKFERKDKINYPMLMDKEYQYH